MFRRRNPVEHAIGRALATGGVHLLPFLAVPLTWLMLLPLALIARSYAQRGQVAAMLTAAILLGGIYSLARFANHVFSGRSDSVAKHALGSVLACGLWVSMFVLAGPRNPNIWYAYLLLGFGLVVTWAMRRVATNHAEGQGGNNNEVLKAVNLAGRMYRPQFDPTNGQVTVPFSLKPGEHVREDLARRSAHVAGIVGREGTDVQVHKPGKNHPGRGGANDGSLVILPPADQRRLASTQWWPGPSHPGESIALPIPIGRREDMSIVELLLPGDARQARPAVHVGVSGMVGSGKSESTLAFIADCRTRADVSIMYSDPVKGIQTVGKLAPAIDWLADTKPKAVAMHRRITHIIHERTMQLGKYGFKQWEPRAADPAGANLKFLIIVMEDAAEMVADSSTFIKIAEQARSSGTALVVSMQRWAYNRVDTGARAQFSVGWQFGCKKPEDAGFLMSEETQDAGAHPEQWTNRRPGMSYVEAPNISPDDWPVELRGFLASPEFLEYVARHYPATGLDPTTAAAAGEPYAEYLDEVINGAASWQQMPEPDTATWSSSAVDDDQDDGDDNVVPMFTQRRPGPVAAQTKRREVVTMPVKDNLAREEEDWEDVDGPQEDDDVDEPEDPDDYIQSDDENADFYVPEPPPVEGLNAWQRALLHARSTATDDEVGDYAGPDATNLRFGRITAARRTTRGQAVQELLLALADAWAYQSQQGLPIEGRTIQVSQLHDIRARIGRSRAWLTGELKRLVAEGYLLDVPDVGVYGMTEKVALYGAR